MITLFYMAQERMVRSMRYVLNFLCVPNNAKTVFYYPDKNAPDTRFEVFETDSDFFISHTFTDFFTGNIRSKHLGYAKNRNQLLTAEQFERLLKNGDEIRRGIYFPEATQKSNERPSLVERIKSLLRPGFTQ